MPLSFWEHSFLYNEQDLTIVGGGFAGLNLALAVKKRAPWLQVRVLEAEAISFGASTKNAGFSCFGSPSELLDDAERSGREFALRTAMERWQGLQKIEELFSLGPISFERTGGHELFREKDQSEEVWERIEAWRKELENALGFFPYHRMDKGKLKGMGFKGFHGGIRIEREGILNPFKLHAKLLEKVREEGVEVLLGTKVERVRTKERECELFLEGKEEAFASRQLVIACNGFSSSLIPDSGVEAGRGQVLITEPLEEVPFRGTFHMDKGDIYFRNVGKRVLLGGRRAWYPEEERTQEHAPNQKIRTELERMLREELLPSRSFGIEYAWSGIMGFTADKRPRMEKRSGSVSLLAGFSGMGVALAFQAGDRMAEKLLEDLG